MSLLIAALTLGLILSLLAVGVLISFRIFGMPDITADGSITLGAALTAVLCVWGISPWVATLLGFLAGMLAGMVTGILHTRFRINGLLSGILVMTALYSLNLRVMGGRSNITLMETPSLKSMVDAWGKSMWGSEGLMLMGWRVHSGDLAALLGAVVIVGLVSLLVYLFFNTELGTAMRGSGDNSQMMRALGGNVDGHFILGLAISNGLIALSGSLLAQYQGFADAQMGIGMVIWGLASVIIGESLTGERRLRVALIGAVMGSVLFRLLVSVALRWGLNPNDLKLITAVFVLVALVLPGALKKLSSRRT
jgi:putative ABC transport system permease protein